MTDALRMEWVRVRTVRSSYVLALVCLGLGLAVALVLSAAVRPDPLEGDSLEWVLTSASIVVPLPFVAVVSALLGVLTVGHDYRHGLVQPVLLAAPRRFTVLLARLTVVGACAVLVTVASVLVNLLAAALANRPSGFPTRATLGVLAGYVVFAVLWGWLGAGATWLLRSNAGVLVVLFVTPLVVEPLLQAVAQLPALSWARPLVPWLPFSAGRSLLLSGDSGGLVLERAIPSALAGGAVFAALVLVVLTAGGLRFCRRDA